MPIDINFGALQAPNPFGAYAQGVDMGQQMRQRKAQAAAGNLFSTDPDAAAQTLASVGDIEGAANLTKLSRQNKSYAAQQKAAGDYAKGDYQGAVADLADTGDIQTQASLVNEVRQQHQAQMQYAAQQATKLRDLYEQNGGDQNPNAKNVLLSAFDAAAPNYQAMGSKPEEIAQLRASLAQSPTSVLQAIANPPEIAFQTAGNTVFALNKATGKKVGEWNGSHIMTVGPFDKVIDAGGGDGGGGAAAPGAPAAQSGALDPKAFYKSFVLPHEGGLNPHDMNGAPTNFGINQSANPGVDVTKLTPDSAADIFANKYWAKSGAGNLPPAVAAVHADTYFINPSKAQQFLQQSGGDPQKYMQLREAWMQNMVQNNPAAAKYANAWAKRNQDLAQYASSLSGAQAQQPTSGGARVIYDGASTLNGGGAAGGQGLSGDAYLKALPPAMASQVKAIAEGRMPVNPMMMRSPAGAQLLAAVSQYDPSFDAVNYQARAKTRQDFTSGASAKNLTAFNTALAHLSGLETAIDNLHNTQIPLISPQVNAVKNFFAHQSGDAAPQEQFETVKRTAMDEVNKAIVGAGGALADREALMDRMNAANSPKELHGVVHEIADLLQGKINSLQAQYQQGMGTDRYPLQMLTPQAQQTLSRIEGGGASKPAGTAAAPSGWSVKRVR